jgi:hypothetical protein
MPIAPPARTSDGKCLPALTRSVDVMLASNPPVNATPTRSNQPEWAAR